MIGWHSMARSEVAPSQILANPVVTEYSCSMMIPSGYKTFVAPDEKSWRDRTSVPHNLTCILHRYKTFS